MLFFQLYFPPSSHWWIFIFVSRHLINQYVSSGMCGILCPFFNSMICFMIEKNHIYTLWKSKYFIFNFICNIHRPYKLSIIMIKPSKFTMYWTQITPDTFTCHTKNYICNIEKMVQVLSIGTSNHRDHIKISIYIKLIFLWMSY